MTTTVTHPAHRTGAVDPPILRLREVRKEYAMGTQVVRALRGVDLQVDEAADGGGDLLSGHRFERLVRTSWRASTDGRCAAVDTFR